MKHFGVFFIREFGILSLFVICSLCFSLNEFSPNHKERRCELSWPPFHPVSNRRNGEPISALYLIGMQHEWSLSFAAIDPDMFLIRLRAGSELEQPLGRCGQAKADLFSQFTNRAGVVVLARIHMA